jgi:type IV secretory pathway VirB4 component
MNARDLLRHYHRSRPFHRAVPVRYFANDKAFVTRDGACGIVLSLRGVDDECLTAEHLEALSHTLATAYRLFDERFRLYQYLIKTRVPDLPRKQIYASEHVENIVRDRAAFLAGRLSGIECYLVILYEPGTRLRLRTPGVEGREADLDRLLAATHSFQHMLGNLYAPRILSSAEAFRFLRFLLRSAQVLFSDRE